MRLVTRPPDPAVLERFTLHGRGAFKHERKYLKTYAILAGYFLLILTATLVISNIYG